MARQPKSMIIDIENAEKTFNPDNPVPTEAISAEEPATQALEEPVRSRVGRPRNRTFTKKNAIPLSVYFPADMKDTLESASFFGKVDQSDIVRAAVRLFIKEHTNGNQLKPSGLTIVRDYITETTVK